MYKKLLYLSIGVILLFVGCRIINYNNTNKNDNYRTNRKENQEMEAMVNIDSCESFKDQNNEKYIEATRLLENKQCKQALILYCDIRGYKDVTQKIIECLEKEAKIIVDENGNIEEAIELYFSLVEFCPEEAMEEVFLISQLYAEKERYYDAIKILEIIDVSAYQHDVDPIKMLDTIKSLSNSIFREQYEYF